MTTPNIVRAADALVRHNDAKFDGLGVTLAMLSVEGQADAIETARIVVDAALAHSVSAPSPLRAGRQSLARELWAAIAFDDEAAIPASILLDIAKNEALDIDPCFECNEYDGHSETCAVGGCDYCGQRGPCACDDAYERAVGK